MQLQVLLRPIFVLSVRETTDTKPQLGDMFLEPQDTIITKEYRQIAADKLLEISIHTYKLIAKTMGPTGQLIWRHFITDDSASCIEATVFRALTSHEYYHIVQMLDHIVWTSLRQPIVKKISPIDSRNVLLHIKPEFRMNIE